MNGDVDTDSVWRSDGRWAMNTGQDGPLDRLLGKAINSPVRPRNSVIRCSIQTGNRGMYWLATQLYTGSTAECLEACRDTYNLHALCRPRALYDAVTWHHLITSVSDRVISHHFGRAAIIYNKDYPSTHPTDLRRIVGCGFQSSRAGYPGPAIHMTHTQTLLRRRGP